MLKSEIIETLNEALQGIYELKRYAESAKFSKDPNMNAGDVTLRCDEILSQTHEFTYWNHDRSIKS
jgi:hypothetical protein